MVESDTELDVMEDGVEVEGHFLNESKEARWFETQIEDQDGQRGETDGRGDDGAGISLQSTPGVRFNLGVEERSPTTEKPIKEEIMEVVRIMAPVSASFMVSYASNVTSVLTVGRLGDEDLLAAGGLANMFVNVTGLAVLIGLLSAQETLSNQAYGARNYRRVGYLWMRSYVITSFVMILTSLLWWFSGSFLTFLGQEEKVSQLSQGWCRIMILSLPGFTMIETSRRYLQAQGLSKPAFHATLVGLCIQAPTCVLLVHHTSLGYLGAPASMVVGFNVTGVGLLLLARFGPAYDPACWPRMSDLPQVFKGWGEFMKYGLPGFGMASMEWIGYEVCTLMVGLMNDNIALAAHNIAYTLIPMIFMVPLGISIATGSMIGSAVGAGNPREAKRVMHVTWGLNTVGAATATLLVVTFHNQIAALFAPGNAQVQEMARLPLIVAGFFTFLDWFQGYSQGVLRGTGLQAYGTPVILVGIWVIGLPLTYCFLFVLEWGVFGVWLGFLIGYIAVDVFFVIFLLRIDWQKISDKAREMALADRGDDNDAKGLTNHDGEMVDFERGISSKDHSIVLRDAPTGPQPPAQPVVPQVRVEKLDVNSISLMGVPSPTSTASPKNSPRPTTEMPPIEDL